MYGIALSTLAVASPCASQILPFHHYSTGDGLVANTATCLFQDSHDYLWIGTTEGVSVYDGYGFKNYTVVDGLTNSYINWITESTTQPGVIWIATNGGGVCRWDGGKIEGLRMGAGRPGNAVNRVVEDRHGILWCGTDGGLFRVEGRNIQRLFPDSSWEINSLNILNDSTILFGTWRNLYSYAPGSGRLSTVAVPLNPGSAIVGAGLSGRSEICVTGSDGRIVRIREGSVAQQLDLKGYRISSPLSFDPDNNLWVGTLSGVLKIPSGATDVRSLTRYNVKHGLLEDPVTAVYVDRERNLWVASATRGISRLSHQNVFRFPLPRLVNAMNDAGVAIDANDHVWTLAGEGLLEIWRTRDMEWQSHFQQIRVRDSLELPVGVLYDRGFARLCLWYGGGKRIDFYKIRSRGDLSSALGLERMLVAGTDLPSGQVVRVILGRRGRYYCSISGAGIAVLDPGLRDPVIRLLPVEDSVPAIGVRTMWNDHRGNLWTGGAMVGAAVLEGADSAFPTVKRLTVENGLCDNYVREIYEDHLGRMWIGTRYGGVTVMEHNTPRTISVRDGLLSNGVWSINEDSQETLWLGTQSGLQAVRWGVSPEFTSIDELHGSVVSASAISPARFLCAFSPAEATVIDLHEEFPRLPPPPIRITSIRVNGEQMAVTDRLELSSTQTNVALEFAGISFASAGGIRYRYRLGEVDREWQGPTTERSVTFAALKPGNYRFTVTAINADGVESREAAVLSFTVGRPFWQQWWFVGGAVALLGSLLFGVYRFRVRNLLELERLRSRIAGDLHDDIGADLSQIAIFSEVMKSKMPDREAQEMLEKIGTMARRIIGGMSDLVWYIDPRHDTVGDLIDRVGELAGGLLQSGEIRFSLEAGDHVKEVRLSPETRKELFLIMKEALHNAVRHSACTSISVSIGFLGRNLQVDLQDNGRGIGSGKGRDGHGLENMRRRAESIGGSIRIDSGPGSGTRLHCEFPRAANHEKPATRPSQTARSGS